MELTTPTPTAKGPAATFTGDGTVIRLNPGQVVWTPPGEEHWHGAGSECMMAHIAMLEGVEDGNGTDWLEPVTDEQYEEALRA